MRSSERRGAKVTAREGNNSDLQLRSLNIRSVESNEVRIQRQPGCLLGSSNSFKECVTAHRSSVLARKIIGHKRITEAQESMKIDW
jgi:hypothetical protein